MRTDAIAAEAAIWRMGSLHVATDPWVSIRAWRPNTSLEPTRPVCSANEAWPA